MKGVLAASVLLLAGCAKCPPGTVTQNNVHVSGTTQWCRYDPDSVMVERCLVNPYTGGRACRWEPFR
jgi:hypothetical protein